MKADTRKGALGQSQLSTAAGQGPSCTRLVCSLACGTVVITSTADRYPIYQPLHSSSREPHCQCRNPARPSKLLCPSATAHSVGCTNRMIPTARGGIAASLQLLAAGAARPAAAAQPAWRRPVQHQRPRSPKCRATQQPSAAGHSSVPATHTNLRLDTHREINQRLIAAAAAETPEQLLALIDAELPAFNIVNAVTAFHRLAKVRLVCWRIDSCVCCQRLFNRAPPSVALTTPTPICSVVCGCLRCSVPRCGRTQPPAGWQPAWST